MGQAREGAGHQGRVAIARLVIPFGRDGASDRVARTFARFVAPGAAAGCVTPGAAAGCVTPGAAAGYVTPGAAAGCVTPGAAAAAMARGPSSEPLEIENLPGEGGLAGVRRANVLARDRAPVLLLATPSTHVLLPARRGAEAAPDARLQPLVALGSAPNVLLASAALGVASVAQLVARARRDALVYASAGTGQTIHLCSALFCELARIRMTHRPYDAGSAAAYADLAAGSVHVYFDSVLACREAIARGEVVPLAVSAATRTQALPAVPTLAECGFPAHGLDVWFGIFGANGDDAFRAELARLAASNALRDGLHALGLEGEPGDGAVLRSRVEASAAAWRRALDAARPG